MTKWKNLLKEGRKNLWDKDLHINQKELNIGNVFGTIYYKEGVTYSRGAVLVHGMSGNRYALGVLAQRLVEDGVFCLSIDLPNHFMNISNFSLGEISEEIREAVVILKTRFGMKSVAVISHSVGAAGALFAGMGYNNSVEEQIYQLWNMIGFHIDSIAKNLKTKKYLTINELMITNPSFIRDQEKIIAYYTQLKQIIFNALRNKLTNHEYVSCYIFLAPPRIAKTAVPGAKLLKRLNNDWVKGVWETLFHYPSIKQHIKEGVNSAFLEEDNSNQVRWQYFRTGDIKEFLDYFLNMKEPLDYITLIYEIIKFSHKDDKISFFEYYKKKYIEPIPKLFIYGKWDQYLMPFLPGKKRKLNEFYSMFGNMEIFYGNFSHVMMDNPKQLFAVYAVKNKQITEKIFGFLDKHL